LSEAKKAIKKYPCLKVDIKNLAEQNTIIHHRQVCAKYYFRKDLKERIKNLDL